ncbi:SH3 domain-containing protein [Hyaloscypha hepaticicola]|uniref:SH3 domain-containing protein n=1 Tax=Hyaloscypha hepaticicola TaxID=2082293 RepID=A0A2J6PR05_9HELO|nr:SH3 domain-containing protein [Hyaloscypha hepaticicola]
MPSSSSLSRGARGNCPTTKRKQPSIGFNTKTALLSVLAAAPQAMAQNCISLAGSTQCSAFSTASISTDSTLVGFFPFLQYVSSTATFDEQLSTYVSTSYVQEKYETLLGCGNINLTNTTNLYARFTTTVICNAIIQNSRTACGLSAEDSRPVCADTCAQQAESEAIIIENSALCTNPGSNADSQIRADFTNCALPANSLTGTCIEGAANEPDNCGFGNSTIGLCQYCGAGGQNSTDTCCYNSKADTRCAGVVLPTITAFMTFSTSAPTSTSTSSASASATGQASSSKHGLSGGAIAGIVVGSVIGLALLLGLVILLVRCLRRRPQSKNGSVFNQPSPARRGQSGMAFNPVGANTAQDGYEVLPGGRIARMSALEGHSGDSPPRGELSAVGVGGAAAGAAAGYAAGRRRNHEQSSSDEYSPVSNSAGGVLRPPPTARRNGSLSSNSVLGGEDPQSPHSGSGGDMSSPQGVASQQSEQLPFFKDYYSQDEIHPGDKVATLWAYQPRASDEFALERGDMLKVVGIWDDGWATGVMIDERADEWDAKRNAQRDSGVSNTSGRRDDSPAVSGEIKAFPLVCVCLPDHWRKTIEGDGSTETGSSAPHGTNP